MQLLPACLAPVPLEHQQPITAPSQLLVTPDWSAMRLLENTGQVSQASGFMQRGSSSALVLCQEGVQDG